MGNKPTTPSPETDDSLFKLTDEGIAEYIEFPSDTHFMESMAHNPKYKKHIAYVPVQRSTGVGGTNETYVYEICAGQPEAKLCFGPIATSDGTEITIFGSALTSKGLLYLACFNRNSLLLYDLENLPENATVEGEHVICKMEIENLPSPNDVCIDPDDENVLYVAGGTFDSLWPLISTFTNAAYGQVFKVTVKKEEEHHSETFAKGFDTLAGIEVVGDDIWVAQLYDVFTLDKNKKKSKSTTKWIGNDKDDTIWLADNVDVFDDKWMLIPAYNTAPKFSLYIMKRNFFVSGILVYLQIASAKSQKQNLKEALLDPEVALRFSNTYIEDGKEPAPIRLIMLSSEPGEEKYFHFEVDLVETRKKHKPWEVKDKAGNVKGLRNYFNEQVTHASHLISESGQGYIVCISFEEPRILMLKDDKFREMMKSKYSSE